MNRSRLLRLQNIAWYLLVASLPLTSMPLIRNLLGSHSVASPAIIFLLVLAVIWMARFFLKDELAVSVKILPLALFCIAAIIASIISFFYIPPLFKGFGQLNPMISAIASLGIGFLFFLMSSSIPLAPDVKMRTLRIINWTGLIILIWCGFQAAAWYCTNHYPQWMFNIQGILSARVLYRQRVTGFALEPSWLAHQLNMLYLPFWISATVTGFSSHTFRFRKISFENILLVGGTAALVLTLSRVGFAAFLCMAAFAFIQVHPKLISAIQIQLTRKSGNLAGKNRKLISMLLILFYAAVAGIFILVSYQVDPRMASLFKINLVQDNPVLRYFNQLKFGDRVVYWLTGWNIFNRYPIIGVGLGNSGFYFPQNMPAYGWSLLEVRRLIYRSHVLLNIKSLWFRLLAETGIIGFSLFVGWIISLISSLIEKYRSANLMEKSLGFAGLLVVLGLVFEGLSIDSFAMPYWWISMGIAVASYKK